MEYSVEDSSVGQPPARPCNGRLANNNSFYSFVPTTGGGGGGGASGSGGGVSGSGANGGSREMLNDNLLSGGSYTGGMGGGGGCGSVGRDLSRSPALSASWMASNSRIDDRSSTTDNYRRTTPV